jgi:dienelactone hydrolase
MWSRDGVSACMLAWVGLLLACGGSSGDDSKTGAATGQMAGVGGALPSTGGGPPPSTPISGMSGGATPGGALKPPMGGSVSMGGSGGMPVGMPETDAGTATDGGDAGGDSGSAGSGGSGGSAAGSGGSAGGAGMGPDPSGPAPTMESATRTGPLNVETILWTEFRNGPEFSGGTIWYPTDGEAPYPFVAVVPGFASYESSISSWGSFLASHGIVAITIDTNTTGDIPAIRAGALLDALKSVAAENMRSGSPLMGKLDETRQAVMGWSMGGGGALIASNRTPSLKAAISMCGWNPGGFYSMMTVPSLMFASLGDPLAGGQSQGFYASIPEMTPKMMIEAGIGDHWVANNPANLSGMIGRYGLSWLKVFLVGDERYRQFLLQMPPGTTDYASNVK